VPVVSKSLSLNLLQSAGPVIVCTGIALPLICFESKHKKINDAQNTKSLTVSELLILKVGSISVSLVSRFKYELCLMMA
jgi:hypothetical protein